MIIFVTLVEWIDIIEMILFKITWPEWWKNIYIYRKGKKRIKKRRYLSSTRLFPIDKLPNKTRMARNPNPYTLRSYQACIVAKQLVNAINEPLKSNFGKNSFPIKRRNEEGGNSWLMRTTPRLLWIKVSGYPNRNFLKIDRYNLTREKRILNFWARFNFSTFENFG